MVLAGVRGSQVSSDMAQTSVIDNAALQGLIDALTVQGYAVLAPVVRDGAIGLEPISGLGDLPRGWSDVQAPGHYRLEQGRCDPGALFATTVGPQSWKRFLHPPREVLWTAQRQSDGGFTVAPGAADATVDHPGSESPRQAFLGVRACELHAIAIQDRVFADGPFADAGYAARRAATFVIAVQCGQAADTCFCAAMGTGPAAVAGFDLALTEFPERGEFLAAAGSPRGAALLAGIARRPATNADCAAAQAAVARAAAMQTRAIDTTRIRERLQAQPQHPQWEAVGERCLTCGNCTMVCPTCFCTAVSDGSDLAGETAWRVREWDSCFTLSFSHLHGGSVRRSNAARYRQWMTHKLANWVDQFGTSGCVGCGRCITWCPVGIDITEVAGAFTAPEDA